MIIGLIVVSVACSKPAPSDPRQFFQVLLNDDNGLVFVNARWGERYTRNDLHCVAFYDTDAQPSDRYVVASICDKAEIAVMSMRCHRTNNSNNP